MDKEKLPIKFFAPREIDELKVEPSGSSSVPSWVLAGDALEQRAAELNQAFGQFSAAVSKRAERRSAVPFVFVAKMCDNATAKSRRGDISSLFHHEIYKVKVEKAKLVTGLNACNTQKGTIGGCRRF